jgi:hypothetical protein
MGNSSSNENVLQQYEGNIEIIEPLNLRDDEMEDDEIQEETDDENDESDDEFYDADEFNDQRVKQKYTTPIFIARFIDAMFVRKIWSPSFSSPYANHIKYIN